MPKVSVIIPTYQSAGFVKEAIDSVLAQTFEDFEIIVVDGGSTDDTISILSSFGKRISILTQNGKGVSNARNVGVSAALGRYIAFLDSDDSWLPNKLESQVEFLEHKPNEVGLIYSNACFFGEENINDLKNESTSTLWVPHKGKVSKDLILGNFIPTSTVMIRKSCFEKIGLFDESFELCEDIDLWVRLSMIYEIDYCPSILAKLRSRSDSLTTNLEIFLLNEIAFKNKIIRENPGLLIDLPSKSFARFYEPLFHLGLFYLLRTRNPEKANRIFRQYIKRNPYNSKAYFLLILTVLPFKLSARFQIRKYLLKFLPRKIRTKIVG
jgi:glycosyltransferase involved in cell wall biosynthesis